MLKIKLLKKIVTCYVNNKKNYKVYKFKLEKVYKFIYKHY